jgi:hypothetical protein
MVSLIVALAVLGVVIVSSIFAIGDHFLVERHTIGTRELPNIATKLGAPDIGTPDIGASDPNPARR